MGPEPVNLSGTVISITSGGGKGKRRPKHLLVVQGQANGIKAHGRLRKRERVYRIRAGSYDPDNYKIGSTIRFKDINERNGGYWEAVDLDYEPNKKLKAQVDLRGMGGRPSSGLERRASRLPDRSYVSQTLARRIWTRPEHATTDLPVGIRSDVLVGIDALISTIEESWHHNTIYGDYDNPNPSNDPVRNLIMPYVERDAQTTKSRVDAIAAYKIITRVLTGRGSTTPPNYPDLYDVDGARRDLGRALARITDEQFDKLKGWAGKQRMLD